MDDSSSGMDLNLDPDMMTTQGGTPQSTVPSPATPTTPVVPDASIIDITPGAAAQPTLTPPVTHIDQAVTPAPRILDITPAVATSPAPIQSQIPPVTPVENITPAPQIITPVSTQTVANPIATPQSFSPPTAITKETPVQPAVVSPINNVPPVLPKNTAGLNIDTSSPLYEDPDKVVLAK